LWLNLGDGYSRRPAEGASTKSLLLGLSRVALALVADGWILRNQVIWAKSNPSPDAFGARSYDHVLAAVDVDTDSVKVDRDRDAAPV